MDTIIKEIRNVKLKNPILICGFPGLGYIGKISVDYLVKKLKAKKLSTLYTPYFPHHVFVDSSSQIRLPKAQFFFGDHPNPKIGDLILLTGDSQALTHEGQYILVNKILNYTESLNVKMVITIDGYISWIEEVEPKVICVSTNPQLLRKMLETGTKLGPSGIPIIGITGLTLSLAKFRKMDAACLLGETMGHMPDPKAAKEVLRVLNNFMGLNIDLTLLDKEIEKTKVISTKIKDAQINIEDVLKEQLNKYEKVTYIS